MWKHVCQRLLETIKYFMITVSDHVTPLQDHTVGVKYDWVDIYILV